MTLIAVIGLAAYGCTKTEKINASATNARCDSVTCIGGSNCDPSSCKALIDCPLAAAKAKPAAAGNAKGCCANKANAKPAAAGDAKSCCANKAKAKLAATGNTTDCPLLGTPECPLAAAKNADVKPAATSKRNKADCNPADCGKWKKGAGSGCPLSGK